MTIYDFSKVPSELMEVKPEDGVYVNAGRLHNLFLFNINSVFDEIGFDADPAIVGQSVINFALKNEKDSSLPKGSVDILTDGITRFLSSNSFNEGSEVWFKLLSEYKDDERYKDTPLIGVLSIAYYSSRFWTYSITRWNSPENPENHNATQARFHLPKWLKVVLVDLGGALAGAASGIEVSAVTGVGAGVGAVIGAVVGAAGASAAE